MLSRIVLYCIVLYCIVLDENKTSKPLRTKQYWNIPCSLTTTSNIITINKIGNLIYSAPTSGGKTLVAELLMLRKIGLFPQGTIFFIVPFVALAEEKAEYLRTVWGDMYIGVKAFHGDDGGQNYTEDISVAVCTIER